MANISVSIDQFVRTDLESELLEFPIPILGNWHSASGSVARLTGTSSGSNLHIYESGGFGSDSPILRCNNADGTTITMSARTYFAVPECYVPGGTLKVRLRAGVITNVSDNTAVVDVDVFENDKAGGVGSQLVTSAAQSINSLVFTDKDFTINAASINPGDVLDIKVTIDITDDTANSAAVYGGIGSVSILALCRG